MPGARIVTSAPGQPDRVSTSDAIQVAFQPSGGIESIIQKSNVVYSDANLRAWGDSARYSPGDQTLYLAGSPRVVEGGMTTTARSMRMVRSTGDAFADGDVKSTYSELKAQPNGALLAASGPIHVTSHSMVIHRDPGVATYSGNARLWQDANVVEAPSIEFDREHRSVIARGKTGQPVSTVLAQNNQGGKPTLVTLTSDRLKYTDNERKAHFEGGVTVRSADATIAAGQLDAYLQRRVDSADHPGSPSSASPGAPSRLEKIVAENRVVITQPGRRAEGDRLVYTAADDQFVLTGGLPSIFDAEHGKVSGDSLTFFRRDGRVQVEGETKSPTVTKTRVAR
jgi:lipopolysaccharide export system protein LptA